jgi:hypothetical protein
MSRVAEDMRELNQIVNELKIIATKSKELRSRKKELELQILQYLESTDAPGLKFKELVVLKTEHTTRTRLKKKEKQENMFKILEDNGVVEVQKVYDAICKSGIGQEKIAPKLKVKTVLPELF